MTTLAQTRAGHFLSWGIANHPDWSVGDKDRPLNDVLAGPNALQQIDACLRFLDLAAALDDLIDTEGGSYPSRSIGLYAGKHMVERWAGFYIPTHALFTVLVHEAVIVPAARSFPLLEPVARLLHDMPPEGAHRRLGRIQIKWTPAEEVKA